MIEIVKFQPEEIDEAIEGLDGLRDIIAPILRRINGDGMGEQDVQQFVRCLTLAKHALIAMGSFLEGKMAPEPLSSPLSLEELREMDGEPVYVTSSIGEQPMWYIVDVEEHELKNPWDRITLEEWDEGYPYRAYRRKPEEG